MEPETLIVAMLLPILLLGLAELWRHRKRRQKAQADDAQRREPVLAEPAARPVASWRPQAMTRPPAAATLSESGQDDSDFLTSMAVGAATHSALAGYAAGGSMAGGMVGAALHSPAGSASWEQDEPRRATSSWSACSSDGYDSTPSYSTSDSGTSSCDSDSITSSD